MEPTILPREELDRYSCPICKEVLPKRVQISPCNHEICQECSKHISKSCPVCREAFQTSDLINLDKTQEYSSIKTSCACGLTLPITAYSAHADECWVVQDENEKSKSNLLDKTKMKETVNRVTFTCPVCKTSNLERAALVDHIVSQHPHQKGVCPICVAQPWGDPNYVTTLSSHLKLRHKYDYDTYTDYDKEDDAILRQVMEQSKSAGFQNFPVAEPAFSQDQDADDEIMRQILELSKHEH